MWLIGTGACLLYGISRVVIGENKTFLGGESYLKQRGAIPDDGKRYVEWWRRMGREQSFLINRGWQRIEALGEEERWLSGVATEDEWAALLRKVAEWQAKWEKDHGISSEVSLQDYHEW